MGTVESLIDINKGSIIRLEFNEINSFSPFIAIFPKVSAKYSNLSRFEEFSTMILSDKLDFS